MNPLNLSLPRTLALCLFICLLSFVFGLGRGYAKRQAAETHQRP